MTGRLPYHGNQNNVNDLNSTAGADLHVWLGHEEYRMRAPSAQSAADWVGCLRNKATATPAKAQVLKQREKGRLANRVSMLFVGSAVSADTFKGNAIRLTIPKVRVERRVVRVRSEPL